MKFSEKLQRMGACMEAAIWAHDRGLKTAWKDCRNYVWMLWLADRIKIPENIIADARYAIHSAGKGYCFGNRHYWRGIRKKEADIIRKIIPYKTIKQAWGSYWKNQ